MKWNKRKVRSFLKSRKGIIILAVLAALIIFRLFLPLIVKNYINNRVLNHIPGYHGHVDDVDIALIRGAYVINGLTLYKNGNKKPMLDFPKTDISIQWGAIFHGKIVSEIKLYEPRLNYYITPNKLSGKETPGKDDWTAALKKLVPIKINRFIVEDGEFLYADVAKGPDIDLAIKKIDLTATNMSNVVDKSKVLPSALELHGESFGNGNLEITANMNLLKEIPDMDVNLSLRNSNVTSLNNASRAIAGFDFTKGQFNFFSEFAISNGYLKGYLKPMFSDIKLQDSAGQPNSNVFKRVWEGVISFFGFVLKNKPKDSFATKIPIEGNLKDPKMKIGTLITNVFRNGFISPFKKQVDNDIKFSDAARKKT